MNNLKKRLASFLTAAACMTGTFGTLTANAGYGYDLWFCDYENFISHRPFVSSVIQSDIDAQLMIISKDDGGSYWVFGMKECSQGGLSEFWSNWLEKLVGDTNLPLEPGDLLHVEGEMGIMSRYPGIWDPQEDCKITKLGNVKDLLGVEYKLPVTGDVNEDDTVDILDCIKVNKQLLGIETLSDSVKVFGDANKDGVLDASDSLAILKEVVGLTERFEEVSNES